MRRRGLGTANPAWMRRVGARGLQNRAHLDTGPLWKGFGAAMSSSPWERLWNGDEDVATPFPAAAVSRCGLQIRGLCLLGVFTIC